MIFDSHAHYDDQKFDHNREEILKLIQKSNVSYVMNVSSDLASIDQSIQLAKQYDFIYTSAGIHPSCISELPENFIDIIREKLSYDKVKAIGEIGLDYHYGLEYKEQQKLVFEQQLQLAKEEAYPVIIHSREACQDTLDYLNRYQPKGVVHCFSGSKEMALALNKIDFYISFTGVITFKNAKKSLEALSVVPLNRLLVETDCPYMAPEPVRGTLNHSGNLSYIIKKIAEMKGETYDNIVKITTENAQRLFDIP